MLIKTSLRMASPSGPLGRLSILIFHRVFSEPDPIFPDEMHAHRFDEMCAWLKSWFNVLPLDAAVAHLKSGTLPARAACITFDDGYADNYDVAMPILQSHGLPATFFIATGFLDGGCMWNDIVIESVRRSKAASLDLGEFGHFDISNLTKKSANISAVINKIKYLPAALRLEAAQSIARAAKVTPPDNLMLSSNQVKIMRRGGMQIGAHTTSHPILAKLSDELARLEIKGSKDFLENLLGERIGLFAYPNGKPGRDFTVTNVDQVRSLDIDAAVTTQAGASTFGDDPFQLPRFTPWDRTKWHVALRLGQNFLIKTTYLIR